MLHRLSWLLLLLGMAPVWTADPDVEILQTLFPGMDVVATSRHRDDGAKEAPDALAAEAVYQVNGPAVNGIEKCAAELHEGGASRSRELRMLAFAWPRTRSDIAAVLQYRFIGASPAASCWTVGLVAHLARRGPAWEVMEERLIAPHQHSRFLSAGLVDVTGDGVPELIIEPDWGGAGSAGASVQVFDLSGRRLRQILETPTRLEYAPNDRYEQTLNVEASREQSGRAVCFDLTQYIKDGKPYRPPRTSRECYPIGTGVDDKIAAKTNEKLRAH